MTGDEVVGLVMVFAFIVVPWIAVILRIGR